MKILFAVFIAALTVTAAAAQTSSPERALAIRAEDSSLQWGACPPIFPKGCEVALLWGDPAAGRSDVFLRSPGNYTFPAHYHTSPEHMILVAGELRVQYAGQKPATLKPGSYAYGPSRLGHDARCTSREGCVLFISFESPVDAHPYEGSLNAGGHQ